MRLIDLDPHWIGSFVDPGRHGVGVSFLCPHCRKRRIFVMFSNPIDGGPPTSDQRYWQRHMGNTFDTLTIDPSIIYNERIPDHPDPKAVRKHWHGNVINGAVLTGA